MFYFKINSFLIFLMFILDDGMLYKINKNFAFTAIPISTPMSNFLIYRDEIRRKTEFSALREDLFTYEFKIVKMNPRTIEDGENFVMIFCIQKVIL